MPIMNRSLPICKGRLSALNAGARSLLFVRTLNLGQYLFPHEPIPLAWYMKTFFSIAPASIFLTAALRAEDPVSVLE